MRPPARRRALQAHKALLLNIERGEPLASAFVTYLAARTGCEPAAVISPDLGQRLTALGVPPQLAGATQELLERLSVRHYSGTGPASPQDPGADTRALRELVASLEREAWRSGPA